MIITSDCQKYHAPCLKIFHRLVLVLERYSVSVADHDQDGRTENGERRMSDGASEYWSIGVLEYWSIGLGAKQIGYAYWLRAH
jgi:hypothetical protein